MALHRLTDEQREFADRHHKLVTSFLSKRRLDTSEYYGVAAMAYLKAVQGYCEREGLKRYSFSTIAYNAMNWAVCDELRKKRVKPLSLDAPIRADSSLTLGDCLAAPGEDYSAVLAADEAERLMECCTNEEKRFLILQAKGYTAKETRPGNRNNGYVYRRVYHARRKIRSSSEASL